MEETKRLPGNFRAAFLKKHWLSRTGREKAQTRHCTGASAVRTPRTQRENKAPFYGLFSFVTSPALQPTQCGASVVSFVVKKIFPLKTVELKHFILRHAKPELGIQVEVVVPGQPETAV